MCLSQYIVKFLINSPVFSTNDKERNCLIDAFGNKVLALVKLHLIESKDASSSDATKTDLLKDILEIYTEAAKYIELTDAKVKT